MSQQTRDNRTPPKRYHVIACDVLQREIRHIADRSSAALDLTFLEQGLHISPDRLRTRLQEAIDHAPVCDAILVGYGLCGNGIEGIKARKTPLVFMRAHDCITFWLGSKKRYQHHFDTHTGTYWYSPGWIDTGKMPGPRYFEAMGKTFTEKFGKNRAAALVELDKSTLAAYRTAAYVELDVGGNGGYRQYARECAGYMGWAFLEIPGDIQLLENFIGGHWPSGDFLVVQPGQSVVPSYDDSIIAAKGRRT